MPYGGSLQPWSAHVSGVPLYVLSTAAIDAWRSGQDGEPTRAEALRRLAARGLATDNESWLEQDLEPIRAILRDALALIESRLAGRGRTA